MKKCTIKILLFTFLVSYNISVTAQFKKIDWTTQVGARKTPTKTKTFLVNNYGAVSDGKAQLIPRKRAYHILKIFSFPT